MAGWRMCNIHKYWMWAARAVEPVGGVRARRAVPCRTHPLCQAAATLWRRCRCTTRRRARSHGDMNAHCSTAAHVAVQTCCLTCSCLRWPMWRGTCSALQVGGGEFCLCLPVCKLSSCSRRHQHVPALWRLRLHIRGFISDTLCFWDA